MGWCFSLTSTCSSYPTSESTTGNGPDFVGLAAHFAATPGLGSDIKITLKGEWADSPWFVMSTPANSTVGLEVAA